MKISHPKYVCKTNGERIYLSDIKAQCESLSKQQIQQYVTQYTNSCLERYENGEQIIISADETRIFTPMLEEVKKEHISELFSASNSLARQISREVLPEILKLIPNAALICIYGPSGAGKSSIITDKNSIRFEGGGAGVSTEEYYNIVNLALSSNPNRNISFIGLTASPDQLGKRVAQRFITAERKIDIRFFPEYMLTGHRKIKDTFDKIKSLPQNKQVTITCYDTSNELKQVSSFDEPDINSEKISVASAIKVLEDDNSSLSKYYLNLIQSTAT
jgi:hypothetical protein